MDQTQPVWNSPGAVLSDEPGTTQDPESRCHAKTAGNFPEWQLPSEATVLLVERVEQLTCVGEALARCAESGGFCGLDAEWPPGAGRGKRSKGAAATLVQVALVWAGHARVFLVDMLALSCHPEAAWKALEAVLVERKVLKIGHCVRGDLAAISAAVQPSRSGGCGTAEEIALAAGGSVA